MTLVLFKAVNLSGDSCMLMKPDPHCTCQASVKPMHFCLFWMNLSSIQRLFVAITANQQHYSTEWWYVHSTIGSEFALWLLAHFRYLVKLHFKMDEVPNISVRLSLILSWLVIALLSWNQDLTRVTCDCTVTKSMRAITSSFQPWSSSYSTFLSSVSFLSIRILASDGYWFFISRHHWQVNLIS